MCHFLSLSCGTTTQESDLTRYKTQTLQPVQVNFRASFAICFFDFDIGLELHKEILFKLHGFNTSRSHTYTGHVSTVCESSSFVKIWNNVMCSAVVVKLEVGKL